ncbi:MAG: hypothetical protein ACR2GT_03850 [Gaiellaceae bacterium]
MTFRVRKQRRLDSLLAHCIARGLIAEQGGLDQAVETYAARAEPLSKWAALRTTAKVTPKASRVAAFIVMWAVGMADEKVEAYSITEYQRYWNESERQAYRLQKEFRELWPELETPNVLATQIVEYLRSKKISKRQVARLPTTLMVTAAS